jgi:hypothetical protein
MGSVTKIYIFVHNLKNEKKLTNEQDPQLLGEVGDLIWVLYKSEVSSS